MNKVIAACVASALLLASLAGCGGEPTEPDPTPSDTPTSPTTPTPEPSPTPTGPVKAPDDPNWTANQLAAVQMIDAYNDVVCWITADPVSSDMSGLPGVAADPQYTADVQSLLNLRGIGRHFEWPADGRPCIIPVTRTVGAEHIVDGRPEVQVVQCDADHPDMMVVDPSETRPPTPPARAAHTYTVTFIEALAGWRVVLSQGEGVEC
jgi:hypothetical protein